MAAKKMGIGNGRGDTHFMERGLSQASPAPHPTPRPVSPSLLAEEKKEREPSLIQRISARLSRIYKDPETQLLIEQFKFAELLSLQGPMQPSLRKMFLYDGAYRKAAEKHGVDIGLLRATVLNEGVFRWDLLNSEGVVDTVTSAVQKGYGGTYGPAQIGPAMRNNVVKYPNKEEAGVSLWHVMNYANAVDAAAQVLAHERDELNGLGISHPSNAQIATRYQMGINAGTKVNIHGRKIEALSKILSY